MISNVLNRLHLQRTGNNEWFGIITYHPSNSLVLAHQGVPLTVTNIAINCTHAGDGFRSLINYYNKNYNS